MIHVVRIMQCGVMPVYFAHFVHLVANALPPYYIVGRIETVLVVGLFSCREALALCDGLGTAREALNRSESEKIGQSGVGSNPTGLP